MKLCALKSKNGIWSKHLLRSNHGGDRSCIADSFCVFECPHKSAGIPTSLDFRGLVIADSKHKGLLPLVKSKTLHLLEVSTLISHHSYIAHRLTTKPSSLL